MTTQNQFKKFKVLGITRDFNVCDCCGKENLAKTVAILDLDFGVVNHYGTTCAAAVDKYDSLEAAQLAKKDVAREIRKFEETEKFAISVAFKSLKARYGLKPLSPGQNGNRTYIQSLNVELTLWKQTCEAAINHYLTKKFTPFKLD